MAESTWVTVALVGLTAAILIVSGIMKKARLGILVAIVLIIVAARLKQTSFAQMGLVRPENWLSTVLSGLLIGSGFSLLSIVVIQPLTERITKQPHDVSLVEGVRGNWKSLLSWLVMVWSVVAFGEELLFHGFLMGQAIKLLGTSILALVANVLFNSFVLGLAHSEQGRSGAWSTGIIGACLCVLYILSGYNLWLPIVAHGAIDTVELVLMSRGADKPLRELIWKELPQPAG